MRHHGVHHVSINVDDADTNRSFDNEESASDSRHRTEAVNHRFEDVL